MAINKVSELLEAIQEDHSAGPEINIYAITATGTLKLIEKVEYNGSLQAITLVLGK